MAAGIAIIHQELNLIRHLSVAENIFLAREPVRGIFIDRKKMRADAQARATLDGAWEAGVRFFDTAPFYGYTQSERLALQVTGARHFRPGTAMKT